MRNKIIVTAINIAAVITALAISLFANINSREANELSKKAIVIANKSNTIAEGAMKDIRAIERLDLEPSLAINMSFGPKRGDPSYLYIKNFSGVDAMQVSVQLNALQYDSSQNRIRIYRSGSETAYVIEKIEALHENKIIIPNDFVDINSRLGDPPEFNIIESCVLFRRDPDRRIYGFRSFYFLAPSGKWVTENNSQLQGGNYDRLIKAARESQPCRSNVNTKGYANDITYSFTSAVIDSILKRLFYETPR